MSPIYIYRFFGSDICIRADNITFGIYIMRNYTAMDHMHMRNLSSLFDSIP